MFQPCFKLTWWSYQSVLVPLVLQSQCSYKIEIFLKFPQIQFSYLFLCLAQQIHWYSVPVYKSVEYGILLVFLLVLDQLMWRASGKSLSHKPSTFETFIILWSTYCNVFSFFFLFLFLFFFLKIVYNNFSLVLVDLRFENCSFAEVWMLVILNRLTSPHCWRTIP